MCAKVSRLLTTLIVLLSVIHCCSASTNKINNETKVKLIQELNRLKLENKQLKSEIQALKTENEILKSKLENFESKWDVRKLMDELFIYRVTPSGKKYDLLFHEGGLGGVAVYQYVGPWLGDAGKWRQYKQIAQLKTTQLQHGYIKPGLVLKPVWGFSNKTIVIRTLGDLLKLEREMNSVDGLAKYFEWLRDNYVKTTYTNIWVVITSCLISLCVGLVVGEATKPITKLADRVTVSAMTYWGERKVWRYTVLTVLLISGIVCGGLWLTTILPAIVAGILTTVLLVVMLLLTKTIGWW